MSRQCVSDESFTFSPEGRFLLLLKAISTSAKSLSLDSNKGLLYILETLVLLSWTHLLPGSHAFSWRPQDCYAWDSAIG
jgi:hypothetical protein